MPKMNEQTRIFLAVILCLTIWTAWNTFMVDSSREPLAASQEVSQLAPEELPEASRQPQIPEPSPVNSPNAGVSVLPKPAMVIERSFRTPLILGSMRNGDGGLLALDLLQFDERSRAEAKAGAPKEPVSMVVPDHMQPAGLESVQASIVWDLDHALPPAMDFTGPEGLILSGTAGNGLQTQLEAVPRSDAYAIDYVLRISNPTHEVHQAGASVELMLTPWEQETGSFFAPRQDPLHGLCNVAGSLERRDLKDLAKAPYVSASTATWAALDRGYFVLGVVPLDATAGQCAMRTANPNSSLVSLRYTFAGAMLKPQDVWEQRFSLYAGPKRDLELGQVSSELRRSIDFTLLKVPLDFLGRPMVSALNAFFKLTGSWGVSIMLLTLSIKLLLFPVSYKSMMSMRKGAQLAPELAAIRDKYAHDKDRQSAETFKLYKERGVNPVAGCLPMLLQMPVWLTLYKTLGSAVDLYQQSFLWLPDLSVPEQWPVLAILVGGITVLQQRMTPMAADNQQAKVMMTVMPIMFTGFMIYVPSGLVLYIMTNSILTILQQLAINSRATASPQKVSVR